MIFRRGFTGLFSVFATLPMAYLSLFKKITALQSHSSLIHRHVGINFHCPCMNASFQVIQISKP